MTDTSELDDVIGMRQRLNDRLSSIVRTNCSAIGCKNCGLKFGGFDSADCIATELNNQILELDMKEFSALRKSS